MPTYDPGQQLAEADRRIKELVDWKESAMQVFKETSEARDAGMTEKDKQRYLGRSTAYIISDLWRRVHAAEADSSTKPTD